MLPGFGEVRAEGGASWREEPQLEWAEGLEGGEAQPCG